ncbi:MAG: hypothetical protein E7513_00170 [Ruminococcaceae bacterium]|nr:hypothetical protein [Oscillospiraceae bacterium]
MSNYSRDKGALESKKSKRIRITMAVLYFIQVVLTTFPFMWGVDDKGNIKQLTAFELAIQPDGYNSAEEIKIAFLFAVFVLFPAVCFFFCILDKSQKKNFISFACCIICACLITFGIGQSIAMGAVVALLLYVLILFFTTQSLLSGVASANTEA